MITIRPTVERDVAVLTAIQREAFLPLYERYHDAGNPCLRGEKDVRGRLGSPHFRYFTILEDGEIVGGVLYKCCGHSTPFVPQLADGEYYLQRVYIRPDRQSRGIAAEAIGLCEREFADAVRFIVDFPQDLEKNRRCYEKAGFADTGKRLEAEPGLVLACFEKHVKS